MVPERMALLLILRRTPKIPIAVENALNLSSLLCCCKWSNTNEHNSCFRIAYQQRYYPTNNRVVPPPPPITSFRFHQIQLL